MVRELRVGDRVRCVDGSWSFGISNGRWDRLGMCNSNKACNDLLVLATGLNVKRADPSLPDGDSFCDIMVTDGLGNYWFLLERLCRLLPEMHTITIDGKDIEISDESFENLKRQLT